MSLRIYLFAMGMCTFITHGDSFDDLPVDIKRPLLAPIKFTRPGLEYYFKYSFNQGDIYNQVLSRCFEHTIDCLKFGMSLEKPRGFIDATFSMFHQRYMDCNYINVHAYIIFLEQLPSLLGPVFEHHIEEEREIIKGCIRSALKKYQSSAKQHTFMDTVADEIIAFRTTEPTIQELQFGITRFLENVTSKLVWDVREQEEVWKTVKTIAQDLETLATYGILPDTKILNQLYWSLITRFCYFIDCAGSNLSLDCYKIIYKDLDERSCMLLALEEQEELMKPKVERLRESVKNGIEKAMALNRGIATDGVVQLANVPQQVTPQVVHQST